MEVDSMDWNSIILTNVTPVTSLIVSVFTLVYLRQQVFDARRQATASIGQLETAQKQLENARKELETCQHQLGLAQLAFIESHELSRRQNALDILRAWDSETLVCRKAIMRH